MWFSYFLSPISLVFGHMELPKQIKEASTELFFQFPIVSASDGQTPGSVWEANNAVIQSCRVQLTYRLIFQHLSKGSGRKSTESTVICLMEKLVHMCVCSSFFASIRSGNCLANSVRTLRRQNKSPKMFLLACDVNQLHRQLLTHTVMESKRGDTEFRCLWDINNQKKHKTTQLSHPLK